MLVLRSKILYFCELSNISSSVLMKSKKILVWFRNDLRLHDNEMLVEAIAKSDSILPVYFFDPRYFESTPQGTFKSGALRTKFLIESVQALRISFQNLGGDILILKGKPEELLPELVEQYDIAEVYHHREVGPEETKISAYAEDRLWKLRINLRHFIGHTLYNKEDLPFPIKDIPDAFTQFKKKTERDAIVKACFLAPEVISFEEAEDWGQVPVLEELLQEMSIDETELFPSICGGEPEGLKHLKKLLEEGSDVYQKVPAKLSAGKQGFSSKLSAWLSFGCLSPRMVFWLVKDAEDKYGANPNFNQILLGLLWRDYFRFMFKKHGMDFFNDAVLEFDQAPLTDEERGRWLQWMKGQTGNPLVDKYMGELNQTGFIPHSARLLTATFLIHVLKINWVRGATYFEERLIDYSPASNWCNWAIVAGGGKDQGSKKNTFDLDKQFKLLNIQISDLPVAL